MSSSILPNIFYNFYGCNARAMLDWINKPSKELISLLKLEMSPCCRASSSFLIDEIMGV
jgi:hypothetical protein